MSDKILKLDQAQTLYSDLRERIDALPTSSDIPEVPVQDVQINGTSILSNGVANIPKATSGTLGVARFISSNGIAIDTQYGTVFIIGANSNEIKGGINYLKPIVPDIQHEATFYGLAKVAGHDEKDSTEPLGTYTSGAKAAIQNMLGVTNLISTEESSTATAAHAINSTFMMDGKLHRATAAIAIGDAVEVGTNCEVVKADEVFVKRTDYATGENAGVVKVQIQGGLTMINGVLALIGASEETIKEGSYQYVSISPKSQHQSIFYGLSKAAGVDLKNETVTFGTYPETSKTAIRALIGAAAASDIPNVPVQDVQINGTSVLNNGIANIPIASQSTAGVIKVIDNDTSSFQIDSGFLLLRPATDAIIKSGTNSSLAPIIPASQHISVFYGLAKVAGADEKNSTLSVGTYTNTAKSAIRAMLGAASPDVIAVQDEQPTNADTKVWLPETEAQGIQVPTMEDMNTALAGKVSDVQIQGTSITNNGIASLPIAQWTEGANYAYLGLVQGIQGFGIKIGVNGVLSIERATISFIKAGTDQYLPIVPKQQHNAVFYGLAKAAGDTTQSASSNAVGTYTDEAKAAIHTMLGIDPASIAAQVDIPLVETVSGTTPSITGQPNVRYVCGEVSTISITPPASGSVDIIFESGSTAAVLTVPNTVKWPAWFDATTLEADTTYEVLITDGVYGSVMTWAT